MAKPAYPAQRRWTHPLTPFHVGHGELYRTRASGPLHLRQYGFIAFHEALHNLFPWRDDVHTAMGDGLAQANVPNEDPNEANKDWLRRGFAVRNSQLL